jgi:hypothetical protein
VVFSRMRAAQVPRPVAPPDEGAWYEAAVTGVRVRVRPQIEAGFVDPRLVSVISGDILPTVSRRDARRQSADVWTSGNRIFQCRGTGILLRIFEALAAGQLSIERVACALGRSLAQEEADVVKRAEEQAVNLISMEQDEQSSWKEHFWGEGISAIAV